MVRPTLLFALLLFCSVARAQKPERPKPKKLEHRRKVFIAGKSLLAASNVADTITTRELLDLCRINQDESAKR